MNEPQLMKTLHAIREKNYEQTKHLSPKELVKKILRDAEVEKKRIISKKHLEKM